MYIHYCDGCNDYGDYERYEDYESYEDYDGYEGDEEYEGDERYEGLPEECPFRQFPGGNVPKRPPMNQMPPIGPNGQFGPLKPPVGPPMAPGEKQGQHKPQGGPPKGTPPKGVPAKPMGMKAVAPGSIRPCTFRYVYLWLDNGSSFWAYLINVGRRSVSGWRWNGRRWEFFGVDTRRIDFFVCS